MGNLESTLRAFEKLTNGEKRDLFQRLLLGSVPLTDDAIKIYRQNRHEIIHVRKDMGAAKANFRRLSKQIHPDKWKHKRSTEVFQVMSGCFELIEEHKLTFFTYLETPMKSHDRPDPWERMWSKTLEVCMDVHDHNELDAEDLAEFIISEGCRLACEDSVQNFQVDMWKGVEGYFNALNPSDARRAVNIVSMLRAKVSRRAKVPSYYDLVRDDIKQMRASCMYNRRVEKNPDYTRQEFYKEYPDVCPPWWPRGACNNGFKKAAPAALFAKPMPPCANVQSFKPRSFAEWMEGRKRVEREHGNHTRKKRGGAASTNRTSAPKRKAPRTTGRCVFVDDEAEDEDEDEEEVEEEDEIEESDDGFINDEEEEEEEGGIAMADDVAATQKKRRAAGVHSDTACSSAAKSCSGAGRGCSSSAKSGAPLRKCDIRNFFVRRASTASPRT
eukprot:jgi/Mesvir1/17345/Mv01325-RA.1